MMSFSEDKQTNVIEAFKSTPRYLADLLNIDNPYDDSCKIFKSGLPPIPNPHT